MALNYQHETIYFVECDGCRSRGPIGFHKFVAIFKARHAGYQRHETGQADKPAWVCPTCQKEYEKSTQPVSEKAPLQVVSTRS